MQLERLRSRQLSSLSSLQRSTLGNSSSHTSRTPSSNSRGLSQADSFSTHDSSAHRPLTGQHQPSLPLDAAREEATHTIPEEHRPDHAMESADLDWILSKAGFPDAPSESDLHSSSASSHEKSDSAVLAWDKALDEPWDMTRSSMSSDGSASGHYNPQNDVVSRIETLGERSMRSIVVGSPIPSAPLGTGIRSLHIQSAPKAHASARALKAVCMS